MILGNSTFYLLKGGYTTNSLQVGGLDPEHSGSGCQEFSSFAVHGSESGSTGLRLELYLPHTTLRQSIFPPITHGQGFLIRREIRVRGCAETPSHFHITGSLFRCSQEDLGLNTARTKHYVWPR